MRQATASSQSTGGRFPSGTSVASDSFRLARSKTGDQSMSSSGTGEVPDKDGLTSRPIRRPVESSATVAVLGGFGEFPMCAVVELVLAPSMAKISGT